MGRSLQLLDKVGSPQFFKMRFSAIFVLVVVCALVVDAHFHQKKREKERRRELERQRSYYRPRYSPRYRPPYDRYERQYYGFYGHGLGYNYGHGLGYAYGQSTGYYGYPLGYAQSFYGHGLGYGYGYGRGYIF